MKEFHSNNSQFLFEPNKRLNKKIRTHAPNGSSALHVLKCP